MAPNPKNTSHVAPPHVRQLGQGRKIFPRVPVTSKLPVDVCQTALDAKGSLVLEAICIHKKVVESVEALYVANLAKACLVGAAIRRVGPDVQDFNVGFLANRRCNRTVLPPGGAAKTCQLFQYKRMRRHLYVLVATRR